MHEHLFFENLAMKKKINLFIFKFIFFIFFVSIRVNNDSNEAERIFLLKYKEHTGDTLALCCRRRTWVAAISYGELHQALIRRSPNRETTYYN